MTEIIPAILVKDFEQFKKQLTRAANLFSQAQVDVMDGSFVFNKSFPERKEINDLAAPIKLDLHLMVQNPLEEMARWAEVKTVSRVVFHIEAAKNPEACLAKAKEYGWETGLALNPETELNAVLPWAEQVQEILFMTVKPGIQGAVFVPEVSDKIRAFANWRKEKELTAPKIAADGGIKIDNIAAIKSWGVEIFYIGSSLIMSEDMALAYADLKKHLSN